MVQNSDIRGTILQALQTIFTQELQEAVGKTDPLYVKKLDLAPLQDDPTKVAPFLVYAPNYQLGTRPLRNQGGWQIGGDEQWLAFFMAQIGTPKASNKLAAQAQVNELANRVERAVLKHYDLSNVLAPGLLYSPDQSQYIDDVLKDRVWGTTVSRIYGGDQEFYGTALMIWSYPYYRLRGY